MASTNYTIQYILEKEERERKARLAALGGALAVALTPMPAMEQLPQVTLPPLGSGEETGAVIHITDLQDYGRCKRAWNWSSMLRRGLQPVVSPVPLFFGSAIHYALDHGYRGCIGQPVAKFELKAALNAFREWIKQHIQRTIEYSGPLWEFEENKIEEARQLGVLMLRHYDLWSRPLDRLFKVIGMEYKFKVPLPGHEKHHLYYAGRFDGYLEDIKTGTRYLLEFKTAKSIRSRQSGRMSSNIEGVLRGMQSAAYTWASGQIYPEAAQGVLYRFLYKGAPDMPKPLQTGGYSRAKTIKSSEAWFKYVLYKVAKEKKSLLEAETVEGPPPPTIEQLYESEIAQAAGALGVIRSRQTIDHGLITGNEFFLQLAMTKKIRQVSDALLALINEGERMSDVDQTIYPTPGFHCNWCSYRALCDMIAYGHEEQVEAILAAAYGPRTYWEPEVEEEY